MPGLVILSARMATKPISDVTGSIMYLSIWSDRLRVFESGSPIGAITKAILSSVVRVLEFLPWT